VIDLKTDSDFGSIEFRIDELMKRSGMSKSKIAFKAELQRTQLNTYMSGKISRIDLAVLCRLCCALGCNVSDIIRYTPPKYINRNAIAHALPQPADSLVAEKSGD
jgi:putative transcriptional regulator